MKKILSLFVVCLWFAFLPAQAAFVPFHDDAGESDIAGWQLDETRDGITVTFEFPGVHLENTELDGTEYQRLDVSGCGLKGEDGEPYMPFKGMFLEVPRGVEVHAAEISSNEMILDGTFSIFPKQPAQLDCADGTPPEPVISAKAYALDGMFPVSRIHLADSGVIRGRRLVFLEVSPLQYNPAQGRLTACSEITVHVSWTGTPKPLSPARQAALYSPTFEAQASRLLANYSAISPARSGGSRDGAEYLIICADMFADELAPLAEWKTLKGYHTTIATLTEVGGTTEAAIQAYLQNAYDTWDPVPEYVLLVGDSGQLSPGSAYGYPGNFISDLPYSCLDGSDYFADVFLGRFAVENEAECTVVVNKVMTYDRNPVAGTWYESFLVAAYFQDYYSPTCEADRWFFETGCLVMQYLENTIGMNPYTAGCTSASGCSQYHPRSDSYPHRPTVPDPFPSYWTDIITSASQATADIHTAFAAGVSLIQHRDHGEELGWADPPFYVSNVNTLTNGNMLPVVNSINCLTGAFSYSSDCFAEALQIKDGGGAVGVIASTEVSMSGYNDLITHGMFTCYYPDYDSTHTGNIYDYSKRPCEAMNYGKYYMYEYEGASATYTQYEFELFHWFGDPEMQLRNTIPVAPTVEVPSAIPAGSYSVVINCSNDGARIALSQEGTILGVGIASGGTCTIILDVPVTAGIDV
nr:C25 family cysteine peptidase [bacterium]